MFGLPQREDGKPCPLNPVYQAVRNVAAALALRPKEGLAVFGLDYDGDNPYFAGCDQWPGRPRLLRDTLADAGQNLRFCAASWQELMSHPVLDDATREWAQEARSVVASMARRMTRGRSSALRGRVTSCPGGSESGRPVR
jgi:hypothetical protein